MNMKYVSRKVDFNMFHVELLILETYNRGKGFLVSLQTWSPDVHR